METGGVPQDHSSQTDTYGPPPKGGIEEQPPRLLLGLRNQKKIAGEQQVDSGPHNGRL